MSLKTLRKGEISTTAWCCCLLKGICVWKSMLKCLNMVRSEISSRFKPLTHCRNFIQSLDRLTQWSKARLLEANRCQGSERVAVVTAWRFTAHSLWIIHEILHKVLYLATGFSPFPFGNPPCMMSGIVTGIIITDLFCSYSPHILAWWQKRSRSEQSGHLLFFFYKAHTVRWQEKFIQSHWVYVKLHLPHSEI